MSRAISLPKNYFYTNDHEWIDFNGSVAYIGVCDSKLMGLKEIRKIEFCDLTKIIRQGEVLATIISGKEKIKVHMPVDGRFIENNEKLLVNPVVLITQAQKNGWITKIAPTAPYSRTGLLKPEQYYQTNKRHYKI